MRSRGPLLVIAAAALLAACGVGDPPPTVAGSEPEMASPTTARTTPATDMAERALEDVLAERGLRPTDVSVTTIAGLAWPDGEPSCDAEPETDTDADGFRIVLKTSDGTFEYVGDADTLLLCKEDQPRPEPGDDGSREDHEREP